MAKTNRNTKKGRTLKYQNSKVKSNRIKKSPDNKRIVKKKLLDEKEFITDLSFIDKYEEEEKKRIIIKEKENIIKNRNKNIYKLKICYRPLTNNIELIGNYDENDDTNNGILIKENYKKCCYLLNKDNNIIVPINLNDLLKDDKNFVQNSLDEIKKESTEKGSSIKKKKLYQKKIIKKYINKSNKSFYYLHICKKNLINCILLNDLYIINYINIFLSGNYTGFFEEIKNNQKLLKVDNFNIFLNNKNFMEKNEFNEFEVIGKGKDEYGEYIIRGNIKLIKDLNQYQNENNSLNGKAFNDKVINFGEIIFNKIYDLSI